jgi:hypothetical protein
MKTVLKVFLVFAGALAVLLWMGLPPAPFLEEVAFARRADKAIYQVNSPAIPSGFVGNVLTYTDGWVVVIYGQSAWTGHNVWNYNLAKSSVGDIFVSDKHFCSDIVGEVGRYKKNLGEYHASTDARLESYREVVDAKTVAEAIDKLQKVQFRKR